MGDLSYTRLLISARGYVPVTEKLTLAARVAGQVTGGTPGLGSLYILEGSEGPTRIPGWRVASGYSEQPAPR